jgi:hypothetical protein
LTSGIPAFILYIRSGAILGKLLKKLYLEFHNWKLGILSFFINFGLVYWVNRKYGWVAAGLAGVKHGVTAFGLGGFFGRITERFSELRNPLLAYPLGAVVPTVIAHVFIFAMHYTTGTPLPIESTLVPMAMSMFINTPATIFVLRRGFFRVNRTKPAVKDRTRRFAVRLEPVAEPATVSEDSATQPHLD